MEDVEGARQSLSQVRFQAINEFIGTHLHDADLSPEHLVQALGVSRSYLYKLFVEPGSDSEPKNTIIQGFLVLPASCAVLLWCTI